MTEAEMHVAQVIRNAFSGVRLGDGVGLMQAQGLDDHADLATLARYRSQDEKQDWSSIPASDLNSCFSSLSFFDAEGMRFHLPAFLIAALAGTYQQEVVFHLTCFDHDGMSRFSALSTKQHAAVRDFLRLRLQNSDSESQQPIIERALSEYWNPQQGQ